MSQSQTENGKPLEEKFVLKIMSDALHEDTNYQNINHIESLLNFSLPFQNVKLFGCSITTSIFNSSP